jgi:hypothetical protein
VVHNYLTTDLVDEVLDRGERRALPAFGDVLSPALRGNRGVRWS